MSNEKYRGKHVPTNPLIELEIEHDRRMYQAYRKTNPEMFNPKPLPKGVGIVMVFGTGGGNDEGQDFKQIWEEAELRSNSKDK